MQAGGRQAAAGSTRAARRRRPCPGPCPGPATRPKREASSGSRLLGHRVLGEAEAEEHRLRHVLGVDRALAGCAGWRAARSGAPSVGARGRPAGATSGSAAPWPAVPMGEVRAGSREAVALGRPRPGRPRGARVEARVGEPSQRRLGPGCAQVRCRSGEHGAACHMAVQCSRLIVPTHPLGPALPCPTRRACRSSRATIPPAFNTHRSPTPPRPTHRACRSSRPCRCGTRCRGRCRSPGGGGGEGRGTRGGGGGARGPLGEKPWVAGLARRLPAGPLGTASASPRGCAGRQVHPPGRCGRAAPRRRRGQSRAGRAALGHQVGGRAGLEQGRASRGRAAPRRVFPACPPRLPPTGPGPAQACVHGLCGGSGQPCRAPWRRRRRRGRGPGAPPPRRRC